MTKSSSTLRNRIAALIFGVLVAVLIVEIVPRVLPGLMPGKVQAVQRIYSARNSWENMMSPHPELGFVLRPGLDLRFPSEDREIDIRTAALGIDGIGYRDIGTKPPYDVVALGDSFTFCDDAPTQSCWVRILADETGLSVVDLGVNGYSNLAEARLLEKVGRELKPKIVLVGFFPNDFKDNVHFHNWTLSGTDDYWTWQRRKRRGDVSEFLARNSVLYRLIDAARRYGSRRTHEYEADGLEFVFRADAWWRGVVARAGIAPTYELTEEALGALARTSEQIGSELVVLLFPFKEQVYWHIARDYHPDGESLDEEGIDGPLTSVAAFLDANGIKYCNLTEALRAEARAGKQLYLRAGAHWTDEGNRVAALTVARCLADHGLTTAVS